MGRVSGMCCCNERPALQVLSRLRPPGPYATLDKLVPPNICERMDEAVLAKMKARVAKCRLLASQTHDERISEALLQMADDGEADIQRLGTDAMLKVEHYRRMAGSTRNLAASAMTEEARTELLELADDYDRKARVREESLARVAQLKTVR